MLKPERDEEEAPDTIFLGSLLISYRAITRRTELQENEKNLAHSQVFRLRLIVLPSERVSNLLPWSLDA
ncbi:hypothetical protein WG66_016312 [Moniliophthora roreri]|nr:hypothetical protein WG66_016312 [Moniliophthora roreri]